MVQANLLAAQSEGAAGQVYNVGTGDSVEINMLWKKIADLANCELKPEYADARPGDIVHSLASIQKIRDSLGFRPSVTFEEGLSRTFAWYEQNM